MVIIEIFTITKIAQNNHMIGKPNLLCNSTNSNPNMSSQEILLGRILLHYCAGINFNYYYCFEL